MPHTKTNIQLRQYFPVSTRRRFDVYTTLFDRQQRCYNVKTTPKSPVMYLIFNNQGTFKETETSSFL